MQKTFEYCYVREALDTINIGDIGNCIIEGSTDNGLFYYLIINTKLGITRILEYGPYIDGGFPTYVNESFLQMDYNEKRIIKRILQFLSISNLTQVRELDNIDEIKSHIVDMMKYMEF